MNIFKNALKVTMVITLLFLFSCKKEHNEPNVNTLTDEIDKVETSYQEGDIKIETIGDPDFRKIETSAPESYKEKIRQELERSYSKQISYLKSSNIGTVGVIKSGTCGAFQELDVFMDCQDGRNISRKSGFVGDCVVDAGGNVTLKFCVIPNSYFQITDYDYAVLVLSGGKDPKRNDNWGTGYGRYFDNEDSGNINSTTLNGIRLTDPWMGDCWFAGNTRLGFFKYDAYATWGSSVEHGPFPNLGISYGVFGRFGNYQGFLITDDEDRGNANNCWSYSIPYENHISSIPNILDAGNNTTLYMSKVN